MPARRRELARSAALRTLLACLLLRTAPPARAAAGAGGIGALSLPQGGAAALRVYLAGGGTRVCYSLNNPDNTAWVGQSGCVASGLPAIPSAATCQALAALGAAAPPPASPPPSPPRPPLPVRLLARGWRGLSRLGSAPVEYRCACPPMGAVFQALPPLLLGLSSAPAFHAHTSCLTNTALALTHAAR